jgi:hypothetical protein
VKPVRLTLPLWLVAVAALPLLGIFAVSLAVAALVLVGVGVAAALLLPLFGRRPPPRRDDGTIELDPSQYRRLPRRGDD